MKHVQRCSATHSLRRWATAALFVAMLLFSAALSHAQQGTQQTAAPVTAPPLSSLAPTQPMGWASWNHYFCDYDERTIREQADALVASGMRDAGYKYVVIQECLARTRDPQGNLTIDSTRFPSGMPALVAYIHKLGLKAGIYSDIGLHTCYPNPRYQGSYGHEQQDAASFAKWGIDFVEMDYCNRVEAHTGRWVYERMAQAIQQSGRPMLFYLCSWGNEQPWEWAQGKAQMWRTDFDISLEKNHVAWSRLVSNFESNSAHAVFSAPESWNDADMLEIGNPGLTDTEAQAQMSRWAMSPSPLLAGADLAHMTAATRAIYLNKEVLAINQDPLGAGAVKLADAGPGLEVWTRPLGTRTGGIYAVMLLNASPRPAHMQVRWTELDLLPRAQVRDLWLHRDLSAAEAYSAQVAAHSATLLLVRGTRAWQHAVSYEAEWPGVARLGAAALFPCGECSSGYAMALGGEGARGELRFRKINVPARGAYTLRLAYTRNGLEDKQITVSVNGAQTTVRAVMRSWDSVELPITLDAGSNEIAVSYAGQRSFYLDRLGLSRAPEPNTGHVAREAPGARPAADAR